MDATWPRPQIDAISIVSDSSPIRFSRSGGALRVMTSSMRSTIFCDPVRHGTHLPHDSLRKNCTQLRACSTMSLRSSYTTKAAPNIDPMAPSVAESSGRSRMS